MTPILNPKNATYDAPTQNEDGSPLALSDIAKFQLGAGAVSGTYTSIVDDTTIEPTKQLTPLSLFSGLKGVNFVAVRTVAKNGQVSSWSAEVTVDFEATPKAPAGFSVA